MFNIYKKNSLFKDIIICKYIEHTPDRMQNNEEVAMTQKFLTVWSIYMICKIQEYYSSNKSLPFHLYVLLLNFLI